MKLEIHSLSKHFGFGVNTQTVLDNISLSVDFPHVLALLGPSGSGKSTLLSVLAGLEQPDEGVASFNGMVIPHEEPTLRLYRRSIGVVFQAFNLSPHMTALKNVMLPLTAVHEVEPATAKARSLEVMDRLGLADHAEKKPSQLSGGQRQRVAIARALASNPQLLLFDEPTSSLDPEMTAEVLTLIAELRITQTPILLVTHEMGFARKIADQVAFLAEGKVVESGSADGFFSNPQTLQAKHFLEKVLAY